MDGQPGELFRANYAWTGACLPVGEHTVELGYASWTVRLSRGIMAAGWAVLLGMVLWGWRRRRPTEDTSEGDRPNEGG